MLINSLFSKSGNMLGWKDMQMFDVLNAYNEGTSAATSPICWEKRAAVMGKISFDFLQQNNTCLCAGGPLICRRKVGLTLSRLG